VQTASLVSGHHNIGQVMTASGEKPWISVAVHLRAGTMLVRCEIEDAHGDWRTIGTFHVNHGRGFWAAPLPRGLVVRKAELITLRQHVLATASIASLYGSDQ
jgi:hypothetical protein